MARLQFLSFRYGGRMYYAIVRSRQTNDGVRYIVRIMNHQLDTVLGRECDNRFEEKQDKLLPLQAARNKSTLSAAVYQELLHNREEHVSTV